MTTFCVISCKCFYSSFLSPACPICSLVKVQHSEHAHGFVLFCFGLVLSVLFLDWRWTVPGPFSITPIWSCRKPISQWQCSFHSKGALQLVKRLGIPNPNKTQQKGVYGYFGCIVYNWLSYICETSGTVNFSLNIILFISKHHHVSLY